MLNCWAFETFSPKTFGSTAHCVAVFRYLNFSSFSLPSLPNKIILWVTQATLNAVGLRPFLSKSVRKRKKKTERVPKLRFPVFLPFFYLHDLDLWPLGGFFFSVWCGLQWMRLIFRPSASKNEMIPKLRFFSFFVPWPWPRTSMGLIVWLTRATVIAADLSLFFQKISL